MEAFDNAKVDPQRLKKLNERIGPPEGGVAVVGLDIAAVHTSESDNSQNENIAQEQSNEPTPKSNNLTTPEHRRPNRKRKQDTPNESRSTKAIKNQRPINAYFDLENRTPSRRNNENNGVSRNLLGNDLSNDGGVTPIESSNNTPSTDRKRRTRPSPTIGHKDSQTDMTRSELERLESGQAQKASAEKDDLFRQNMRLQAELNQVKINAEKYEQQFNRCIQLTKRMLVEKCDHDRKEARRKSMEDRLRLGHWSSYRNYNEKWINGTAFQDLEDREHRVDMLRQEIEKERKALSRRRPPSTASQGSNAKHRENALSAEEYNTQDWVLRNRLQQLKKDEADLQYERDKLHRERSLHIREMKRIQHEDVSKYKSNIELNGRYLLLNLLGKGGFSEVYKAYDSEEQLMVAIKIHQLNQDWTEQKKADYQRHARREAEIQKSINHPKIVRLYDRFEVDINTFCTVLEYCEGNDLDHYLKQQNKISENEAKTIIMQIVQALKYLNELDKPVIHYDLKPGNILLADGSVCGNIKITDFGLSKQIIDGQDGNDGIELTSQGAGTYWYLPPECFTRPNDRAPIIDNRVDVWSIGVIFYQCIYGKKPFGHNQSQQQILENKTIVNATEVHFPAKPILSQDAKDFIRSCLIYRKDDRAQIYELAAHHYFKATPRRSNALKPPPAPVNENSN